MKLLTLFLLTAGISRAAIVGPTSTQQLELGANWPITSTSATYALNNALTGTASSAIDLLGVVGVQVTLTSTASGVVTIYFSNSAVAGTSAIQSYQVTSPGTYYIQPKARYLSFYNATNSPTTRVTAYYYTAVPSITVTTSGTTTITGNVSITASVPLTVTAYVVGSGYRSLSNTSINLTSTYSQNVTAAAGVSGMCQFCFSALGPSAGFYYDWNNSDTAPATFGAYYAVSTTPICKRDMAPGTHLHFTTAAAAATVTVKTWYEVIP